MKEINALIPGCFFSTPYHNRVTMSIDFSDVFYQQTSPEFNNADVLSQLNASLMPHQAQAVTWCIYRETHLIDGVLGGMFCDEPGMGKTLTMLTTILAIPFQTLVIAPAHLIREWERQIVAHLVPGALSTCVYHGKSRHALQLDEFAMVFTSYGTVCSEYAAWLAAPTQTHALFGEDRVWPRIVLDEAHHIRGNHTKTSRAINALKHEISWCITATPIMNCADDLYPLFKFMRHALFADRNAWRNALRSMRDNSFSLRSFFQHMSSIIIKRPKSAFMQIPPRHETVVVIELDANEREIYQFLFQTAHDRVRAMISRIDQWGELQRKLQRRIRMSIWLWILRLRQTCDHPGLFLRGKELTVTGGMDTVLSVLAKVYVTSGVDNECAICFNAEADFCAVPCGHTACGRCWELIQTTCPYCRAAVERIERVDVTPTGAVISQATTGPSPPGVDIMHWSSSAKVRRCIAMLQEIPADEHIIICSQWTGMLDWIEAALVDTGLSFLRIDGSVAATNRGAIVAKFQQNAARVMLLSIGAGGEGLNMGVANHVFIMDPWWNAARERQAADRAHRIGQTREVHVYHFICANTVEENLTVMQAKKTNIGDAAFGLFASAPPAETNLLETVTLMLNIGADDE